MARITVTGGCGFIGSHLVEELVGLGNDVVVVDKLQQSYGFLGNLESVRDQVTFLRADLSRLEAAREAVAGSDIVFHLAAMSHIPVCLLNPLLAIESNFLATANILEASRSCGVEKVIYAGTDHIYTLGEQRIDENSPMRPMEIYALTKAHSVQLCRIYSDVYGLDARVVVSGNVFGERQDESKAVPIFINRALRGQPISVFGGRQSRDFYHVSNLVSAYLLVADKGQRGETYNIGGDEEITVIELARRVVAATGCRSKIHAEEYRADESVETRLHLDISKIKSLGYTEEVGFDVGLARTIEWYRDKL